MRKLIDKFKHTPTTALLFILAFLMTLLRGFIMVETPLYAIANARHDDQLLLTLANSLSGFHWLGDYTNTTLVKGITFPMFVALCKDLALPYLLGVFLFFLFGVLIFMLAIHYRLKNPWILFIIYCFLLYSPSLLSTSTGQRAYNLTLIPGAILLVFGCAIGFFFRRSCSRKRLLPWGILFGLSFSFFWYIRDDSMWLAPFVIAAILMTSICIFLGDDTLKVKITKVLMAFSPIYLLVLVTLIISLVNLRQYGIFTTNERTGTNSARVMSSMMKVDTGEPSSDTVWVSHEAIRTLMKASPTLASLETEIDAMYASGWADATGEISGDIIVWAFRDAVASAGYYKDGRTTNAFYGKIADELDAAFETGKITQKDGLYLSSLSKEFTQDDVPLLTDRIARTLPLLLNYRYTYVDARTGVGTTEQIAFFEEMTSASALYPATDDHEASVPSLLEQRVLRISNLMIRIYQWAGYPIAAASILCYLLLTVIMIRQIHRRQYDAMHLWFILTGILATIFVYLAAVCWFTIFLGNTADALRENVYHYTTGTLMVIQIFEALSLGFGLPWFYQKIITQTTSHK